MDKQFEKIARLSPVVKIAVLVLTEVLIFGVFYFAVIGGTSAKTDETRELANLRRAERELAEAERAKAEEKQECEKLKMRLKKAKRKMRRFRGMLPDDPQIWLLMKEVKAHLGELSLKKLVPVEEEHKRIYTIIPLDVVVEGTFHQLLKFFHDLSTMPRIVNVQDVHLSRVAKAGSATEKEVRLLAEFRITTFRYRQRRSRRKKRKKKAS
jgi:type IV pilus assembly protein PilO